MGDGLKYLREEHISEQQLRLETALLGFSLFFVALSWPLLGSNLMNMSFLINAFYICKYKWRHENIQI